MNDSHEFDQWLRRELTRNQPHIDDEGFTDRVMAQLPPRPPKRQVSNIAALALLALTAGALGLNFQGDWSWVQTLVETFATLSLMDLVQWGMGMTILLAGLVTAVLWPNEA